MDEFNTVEELSKFYPPVLAEKMAERRMTTPTDRWVWMLGVLIKAFKNSDNHPNFDEEKFREACYAEPKRGVR